MPELHPYLNPETWNQPPQSLVQQVEEMRGELLALSDQIAQILVALHGVLIIGIDKTTLPTCTDPNDHEVCDRTSRTTPCLLVSGM